MTKKLKRAAAAVLCVLTAMTMCLIPSFAAQDSGIDKGTSSPSGAASSALHTIELQTDSKASHTFTASQVFTGTLSGSSLTNLSWGKDVDSSAAAKAAVDAKFFGTSTEASQIARHITESDVESFAKIAESACKSSSAQAQSKDGLAGLKVSDGYYLIQCSDSPKTFTPFLVWVKGKDVKAAAKPAVPTVTKTVQNDFFKTDGTWTAAGTDQKAHFSVGFTVPDTTGYTTYTCRLHDTMSKNLKFDSSSVKIEGLDQKYYKVNTGNGTDTFTVDIDALTAVKAGAVLKGQHLTMTYDASVTGFTTYKKDLTQSNEVSLEYSDNPSSTHTTTTDKIKVHVLVPSITFHKVDSKTNKALSGAVFVLKNNGKNVPVKKLSDGVYAVNESGSSEMTTGKDGNIVLIGVPLAKKDAPLQLEETKAPSGYDKTVKADKSWITGNKEQADSVRLYTEDSPAGVLIKNWKSDEAGKYLENKDAAFTVTLFNAKSGNSVSGGKTSSTGGTTGGGSSSSGGLGGSIPKTGDNMCRLAAMLLLFTSAAGLLAALQRKRRHQR